VACNFTDRAQRLNLDIGGSAKIILASDEDIRVLGEDLDLPAESVAVLSAPEISSRV
jgi:hypothetical protein